MTDDHDQDITNDRNGNDWDYGSAFLCFLFTTTMMVVSAILVLGFLYIVVYNIRTNSRHQVMHIEVVEDGRRPLAS